ncbi:MAG: hypothetical protein BWY82_01015 [Verrucomicrobia bacterium ADurb.Bin474]|nr:MAG: hypothetical protein BWY82_01015 [Verrucomicrobia bacterium ADurb.Bin474]
MRETPSGRTASPHPRCAIVHRQAVVLKTAHAHLHRTPGQIKVRAFGQQIDETTNVGRSDVWRSRPLHNVHRLTRSERERHLIQIETTHHAIQKRCTLYPTQNRSTRHPIVIDQLSSRTDLRYSPKVLNPQKLHVLGCHNSDRSRDVHRVPVPGKNRRNGPRRWVQPALTESLTSTHAESLQFLDGSTTVRLATG